MAVAAASFAASSVCIDRSELVRKVYIITSARQPDENMSIRCNSTQRHPRKPPDTCQLAVRSSVRRVYVSTLSARRASASAYSTQQGGTSSLDIALKVILPFLLLCRFVHLVVYLVHLFLVPLPSCSTHGSLCLWSGRTSKLIPLLTPSVQLTQHVKPQGGCLLQQLTPRLFTAGVSVHGGCCWR